MKRAPPVRVVELGERAPKGRALGRARPGWRPWKVYGCGERSMYDGAGREVCPERCDTAGCVDCDRRRLRRSLAPLHEVGAAPGRRWAMLTLTSPVRVTTPEGVRDFRDAVAAAAGELLRLGLATAGWWGLEVGVENLGGETRIPCLCAAVPVAGEAGAAAFAEQHGPQGCTACGGARWLPAAQLHAHVVVDLPPVAFCAGKRGNFLPLARPMWRGPAHATGGEFDGARRWSASWFAGAERVPVKAPVGLLAWARSRGFGRVRLDWARKGSAAMGHYLGLAVYTGSVATDRAAALFQAAYLRGGQVGRLVCARRIGRARGVEATVRTVGAARVVRTGPRVDGGAAGRLARLLIRGYERRVSCLTMYPRLTGLQRRSVTAEGYGERGPALPVAPGEHVGLTVEDHLLTAGGYGPARAKFAPGQLAARGWAAAPVVEWWRVWTYCGQRFIGGRPILEGRDGDVQAVSRWVSALCARRRAWGASAAARWYRSFAGHVTASGYDVRVVWGAADEVERWVREERIAAAVDGRVPCV